MSLSFIKINAFLEIVVTSNKSNFVPDNAKPTGKPITEENAT